MRATFIIAFLILSQQFIIAQTPDLHISWDKHLTVSKSTATLQVVINPMLRKGSPIYEGSFSALKKLGAEYARYAAWYPYPRLSVAQLEPPDHKNTHWDFSLIDPMTIDFLQATKGHTSVLNFCTIPQWMFKTPKPVPYPDDPNEIDFKYSGGTELRDTTLKELSDYYARLFSWYSKGGFTDELGKHHQSGHHFDIPYWEVLNEPELEHNTTPEQYTQRYDAIVNKIHKISPKTKFIGMGAVTYWNPKFFEYFLDSTNHQPGTPIDMISYHFYAGPGSHPNFDSYQYTYFEKTENFIGFVRYIENIRKRLAPNVKTAINELGTMVSEDMRTKPIPKEYWNLSGSVFAYMYMELAKLNIDIIGESQLVGYYPGQFPDVSMINWENGKPNARYWVLKLIKDNFSPGDILVETTIGFMTESDYAAQAFITKQGKKVLLLNKRNKTLHVKVPDDFKGAKLSIVDLTSGESEPLQSQANSNIIEMKPFAVIVASLPK